MRKIASILVFVFAFTFTTQAQKKRDHKKAKLSVEQHTDLKVKKMTLALDLSEKQQNQIKPLVMAQAAERKSIMEKRKENRKNKTKPSADEIYAMKSKQLDGQIAFKNRMKNILNKNQFEKFEKIAKRSMQKGKKMKKKMGMKKRKKSENAKE